MLLSQNVPLTTRFPTSEKRSSSLCCSYVKIDSTNRLDRYFPSLQRKLSQRGALALLHAHTAASARLQNSSRDTSKPPIQRQRRETLRGEGFDSSRKFPYQVQYAIHTWGRIWWDCITLWDKFCRKMEHARGRACFGGRRA